MLQRPLSNPVFRTVAMTSLGFFLAQCGSGASEEGVQPVRQAIVGGTVVNAPDSPVLYLRGPEGTCSAVLVASNLAVTARHCAALTTAGSFACTSDGELVITGSGAGEIGADVDPGDLQFFTSASVASGAVGSGRADAIGSRIVSTGTPSACRDDLSFVVLDRDLPGLTPMPIRLDDPTYPGETISIFGYGLTNQIELLALRARTDAEVLAVGPDMPASSAQLAPVRAIKTGPVTCQGDSGGPIVSSSGAVIAIVSLGSQAGSSGPFCSDNGFAGTIGPRLAAYRTTIGAAFAAAGVPMVDGGTIDAGEMSEPSVSDDGGAAEPDAGGEMPTPDPVDEPPVAPGCAVSSRATTGTGFLGMTAIAIALGALARGRRRGHGRSS